MGKTINHPPVITTNRWYKLYKLIPVMGGKHDIAFPAFGDFPTIAMFDEIHRSAGGCWPSELNLSLRPVGTAQRPEVRGAGCNACGFPPWERCKDSHFHDFSMMCKVGNHENPPFCKVFKVSRLAMIENQWETYPYKLRRTSLSRVCKDTEYPQMINELWWIMPAQRELENLLVWCINAI